MDGSILYFIFYFFPPRNCLYDSFGMIGFLFDVYLGCVDTPSRAHVDICVVRRGRFALLCYADTEVSMGQCNLCCKGFV